MVLGNNYDEHAINDDDDHDDDDNNVILMMIMMMIMMKTKVSLLLPIVNHFLADNLLILAPLESRYPSSLK